MGFEDERWTNVGLDEFSEVTIVRTGAVESDQSQASKPSSRPIQGPKMRCDT